MRSDEDFDRRIRAVISVRFEATGRTRADLARGTGISRSSLDRSLNEDRPFATAEVHSIARFLDVRASALIDEAEAA